MSVRTGAVVVGITLALAAVVALVPTRGPASEASTRPPSGVRREPVRIGPFSIDRVEVTAGDYAACTAAGACPDARKDSNTCNVGKPGREQHPANCLYAAMARAYCAHVGGRLPTAAEWERAARGVEGRPYPWGSAAPDCTRARLKDCGVGTAEVATHPSGATPEGIEDLAGNVWEWVLESDGREGGRGGAFDLGPDDLRASVPIPVVPGIRSNNNGARCVYDR